MRDEVLKGTESCRPEVGEKLDALWTSMVMAVSGSGGGESGLTHFFPLLQLPEC